MKKIASFSFLLIIMLSFFTPVLAASVPAQTFPGNDANDYTPPEGCILYQIPNSDKEGSHTVNFDSDGNVDPDGPYSFTVMTGTIPGNEYTQVLSWSSNIPIYAVIVKGGTAFNLYQYEPSVRGDTDLVSPNNPSGPPTWILITNTIFQIISAILLGILVFLILLLLFGPYIGKYYKKSHKQKKAHT